MIEIQTNAATVSARFSKASSAMPEKILGAMRRIGVSVQKQMVAEELSGQSLNVRTGNLRRAVTWQILMEASGVAVRIGASLGKAVYGRIQAIGGTILPKRGKYLTIPLQPVLTAMGVARFSARELFATKGAVGGYKSVFVNKRGTAIMGVLPLGGVEPVFALKTSVKIKATHYPTKAVRAKMTYVKAQLKAAAVEAAKGK